MAARVVDASILASVGFGEPRAEEAAALLAGHDLYAPTLLGYELASVARRKVQGAPERRRDIQQALADVLALDLVLLEVDQLAVVDLALAEGLTAYDASYLYLSRVLGADLLTFDDELRAAAHGNR